MIKRQWLQSSSRRGGGAASSSPRHAPPTFGCPSKNKMGALSLLAALCALAVGGAVANQDCVVDFRSTINYFPAESQLRSGADSPTDAHVRRASP